MEVSPIQAVAAADEDVLGEPLAVAACDAGTMTSLGS
jgi:hypothetical protein